jgi:hypothetical protein
VFSSVITSQIRLFESNIKFALMNPGKFFQPRKKPRSKNMKQVPQKESFLAFGRV